MTFYTSIRGRLLRTISFHSLIYARNSAPFYVLT